MARERVSVEPQVQAAAAAYMAARKADEARRKEMAETDPLRAATSDSFQNFGLNLGMGTDNALSDSTYGFNPITRQRTLLEWIHRGSWLGGVAVDLLADDMTRAGVELPSSIAPDEAEQIEAAAGELGVWEGINDTIKWGRLYGGAIGVMLIEGQKLDTPLRLKTIDKGQFKGMYVCDRWMVEPSLNDLVTDYGPDMGMPKFYAIQQDSSALRGKKVHYSRVLRMEGDRLPYQQRLSENFWGLAVYERLYDRMVAFDSATQGAAQLVYKSALRTYKIFQMRELIGGDVQAQQILAKYVEMMRRFQGVEGITLIDANDDFVMNQHSSFPGIADALVQFGQQIAGALQIPLVRLFGQSPAGLNSAGESDLVTYYDGVKHKQQRYLKLPVSRIYRAIAASEGIALPDDFDIKFRPLWQLNDVQKAAAAQQNTASITNAHDSGVVSRATALKELKQQSSTTGMWTNITDEEIEEAEDEPPPTPEGMTLGPDGEHVPSSSMAPGEENGPPLGQQPGEEGGEAAPGGPGAPDSENTVQEGAEPRDEPGPDVPNAAGPKKTKENVHLHVHDKQTEIFEESEHPRDPDGKFAYNGGASKSLKVTKQKAPSFQGKTVETKTKLSKIETDQIGERVMISYLKSIGLKNARKYDSGRNNAPIDLAAGDMIIELKTGLINNGDSAMKWRATIGQPGKAESAWLKTAPPEEKAAWNARKKQEIIERKYKELALASKLSGKKLKGKTYTQILNPDTQTVDLYEFDGFHSNIRWKSEAAAKGYVGTFKYEE